MDEYTCQNSSKSTLKIGTFIICKSYLNKIDLKSKNIHKKTLLIKAGEKKSLGNKEYEGPVKRTKR